MDFVVLPDHSAGAEALAPALSPGLPRPKVIEHHSGRPWLVGDWLDDEIVRVSAGPRRLVLLGCTTVHPDVLRARLSRVRSLTDLDDIARLPSGSFHLVASLDGDVRVQGALSTACQVFYARAAGVTLAASRAESLAGLIGASVDTERVALELLSPFGPRATQRGFGVARCAQPAHRILPGDQSRRRRAHPALVDAARTRAVPGRR
ncbi:hypothetical protein HTV45_00190 [Streptomyces sp. CHD11]|uniref:hypothetical protein n=1 Tax=Streptomyces sp. CHD11 TaxID=2741325 RepID=UPI001BFC6CF4|nr:hypothetical protein [Streptomyces sp. CHD11]MBT3149344.1 hypothetical protein [Streptomyces sp. CHD11]